MTEFVTIAGLKETVAALRGLPAQFASKNGGPMRRALFMAAKPMRDNAAARAPIRTGNLSKNIYLYRDRDPKGHTGANERYIIDVRTKRKAAGRAARGKLNTALGRVGMNFRSTGDAYYFRFVERGTKYKAGSPGHRGHAATRPYPFLVPAFESHKGIAVQIFAREFAKGVEAAAKRAREAAHA